jgi:anti-sigma factor RsiW
LDGVMSGKQMHALNEHLQGCGFCAREYRTLSQTQAVLASIGRAKAPDDLSLKVRLAISREAARQRQSVFSGPLVRAGNALRAFMVPATAGVLATLLIFGLVMGFLTLPVQANGADVPLMFFTDPELQPSSFGVVLGPVNADSLVIEAYVGSNGRVQDYRILSDPNNLKELPSQVKNMLIFTTFRPATSMGTPRPGTAVLSFSRISVKG